MAQAKKAQIIITANASVAQQVMDELDAAAKRTSEDMKRLGNESVSLKEQMSKLAAEGKKDTDQYRRLSEQLKENQKAFREAEKNFQAYNSAIRENVKDTQRVNEVMKNLAGTATRDLRRALQAAKRELDNMSSNDKGRKKLLDDMKRIQKQIEANTGSIKAQGNAFATTAKNLATYMIGFAGFNKVKSLVEGVFESNLKLSDSLANIRKVSGLSSEAINQLYRNITKIDTRNTIEMLNQLAYTGAKLGIGQNYGVEGLTGFVKAAEQVQMALGEDMGEKALPELAKMTEVMGLIEKYGVEQSMQKAASAIFQLGATSTATGTNIVEFSKRLYGLANVSRISADELLAIGSASDAMGLMPEVAATAFNKLFTAVQKNHNMIEKTLNLQPGLIKNYYTQGKTMEAVVAIFEKMNETGNLNLLGSVFKDLGSDGARLVNVMATMSDRVDILKKHLETSRDAFKEGEAVIGEYMIQNQTAQAMLERASNLWAKAFINPEGVDMVKQMAQAWYDLSKEMTQSEGIMWSLRTSLEAIAAAIKGIIALSPYLIRFGIIFGSAFGVKAALMGIASLKTAFVSMVRDVKLANGAWATLNATMKSNLFIGIASAILTVATLLYDFSQASKEAAKREAEHQAQLKASYEKSKEAIQNAIKPIETYKKVLDEANLSEKAKLEMVKQFNADYQDYLDYLGIEVKTVDDLRDAYARVVEVMKIKKAYEEREQYRTEVNNQNRMDRIEAQAQAEAEARSLGVENINKKYLEETQNIKRNGYIVRKGADEVVLDILRKKYGDNIGMSSRGQLYRIETIEKNAPKSAANQRTIYIDVDVSGLRNAVTKYVRSYRTETKTNKEIDEKWDSEYTWIDPTGKKRKLSEFDIDEYNRKVQEARWKRKGTLDNEKPDKNAEKERLEKLRSYYKSAKENAEGLIAKIDELYNLQEAVINDYASTGKITQEEADKALRDMKIARNLALEKARMAVATGSEDEWNKFKQEELPKLLVDQGEWATELLKDIQGVSVQKLHDFLATFDGSKEMAKLDASSFFDTMKKKSAANKAERNKLLAKAKDELDKILLKYEYFTQATKIFAQNLIQIGALGTTAEQMAKGMEGVPSAQQTIEAAKSMLAAVIRQGAGIYAVNPSDAQGVANVLKSATKDAKWFDLFPEVKDWMANPDQHKKELEQIFNVMLIAEQDYYQKRKQSYETVKKQHSERFRAAGFTDMEAQTDQALETRGKMQDAGIGASFWQQQGLGSIANDPEVLRIQNRIYWRNEEVKAAQARLDAIKAQQAEEIEALIATHATKEQIDQLEAQQAAERMGFEDLLREKQTALFEQETNMAIKVAQELQKRVNTINSLTKPVQDFAGNVGQKMGEMLQGMKENSMTWNEIFKNMEYALAETVIQMGAQYAQNVILNAAANRAMEADDAAHTIFTVQAGIAAGSAKTIGAMGWLGLALIPVISALLLGLLKGALLSKPGSESSSSSNSNTKTKLVSGMLTYDEGNSYVGTDGHVYSARAAALPSGVGMVTSPIATTVNGQPSLVAEKGPELVIGRRATRHIQMNEPGLLHHLASLNGRFMTHRPYDEGNVVSGFPADASTSETSAPTLDALTKVVAELSATVQALQKKGVPAYINKYGPGGIVEEVKSGLKFDAKYNG